MTAAETAKGSPRTKTSFLTMACSILLSMPTRLPEPLERHGGGGLQVEEEPPVSSATVFRLLPALKAQPMAHPTQVPVTVEDQREEAFVHPTAG